MFGKGLKRADASAIVVETDLTGGTSLRSQKPWTIASLLFQFSHCYFNTLAAIAIRFDS
jgi:hypothetical protein